MQVLAIVVSVGVLMLVVERCFPGRRFPLRRLWWLRALAFNLLQALVVVVAALSWDRWFDHYRVFDLADWPLAAAAVFAYIMTTFVFYWWHRARHEVPWLWRHLHQVHHSPARLEVLTSFYKHPLEMVSNSLITSFLMIVLLGLSPAAIALTTLLLALAEFFYHWNIRTPYWLGYVIQRPESHCIHHERGRHRNNYSDLPVWDILFGTFDNPRAQAFECGFSAARELDLPGLLCLRKEYLKPTLVAALLLTIGCATMLGDIGDQPAIKGLGLATQASPAPKVFTAQQGFETYSAKFLIEWQDVEGQRHTIMLDRQNYAGLAGPYNRRNAYGAAISYGPVLQANEATRAMFESVANYAFCREFGVLEELGIRERDRYAPVKVSLLPQQAGLDAELWQLSYVVECQGANFAQTNNLKEGV